MFDFRMEIRPENLEKASRGIWPTTYIEIIVETMDRSDMNNKIIGFAYFPLFLVKDGTVPPNDDKASSFIYNDGAHQIPVYYNRFNPNERISLAGLQKMPKIDCATLCVRSFQCPVDTRG